MTPAEKLTPATPVDDLPEAIRKVSRGMDRLLAQGLNRRAVIVLLCHHSKLGHGNVVKVLDSLADLERAYVVTPKAKK